MNSLPPESASRKRPRLSNITEDEDYISHRTLYFDDGNVILSCGRTIFRVHRSLLSKHSLTFREMLRPPEEDTKPKILQGCIHAVLDDSADDMEALLNVLYDGLRVDVPQLTVENFPTLSALLRMSVKYQLDRPRPDIIRRIQEEWPVDLHSHDQKRAAFSAQLAQSCAANAAQHAQEDIIIHPASVIALLRECEYDAPDLFSPLFYALSRTTWQFAGQAAGHHLAPMTYADIERFIIGVERLRSEHAYFAVNCPSVATLGPRVHAHEQVCWPHIRTFWTALSVSLLSGASGNGIKQPIEDWLAYIQLAKTSGYWPNAWKICPDCGSAVLREMESRRIALWSHLGAHFDLKK